MELWGKECAMKESENYYNYVKKGQTGFDPIDNQQAMASKSTKYGNIWNLKS